MQQARTRPWQWLGSIVDAFIDVVEPAVARFATSKRLVAVEIGADDFAFHRVNGGRAVLVGHASSLDEKARRAFRSERFNDVELRLLPERIIEATLKLPPTSLDYVEQVVESRLDRLTPWKPEKVLYGFACAPKAGADGMISVTVAVTTREIAASSVSRLELLGLAPSRLGSGAEPIAHPLRIDLFRGRNDQAYQSRRRRISVSAVGVLVTMTVAYLASAYTAFESAGELADLDRRLSLARNRLLQGSSSTGNRQTDLVFISGKTVPTARFVLIDRLAGILPENTFLDELDIQPSSLRIAGTSTEASALIQIIEAEPALSDAKFSAPVTRQADGRDRFDITATYAGKNVSVVP